MNKKNKVTKILIVEDERPLADLLSSKLQKEGYDVENAFDGQEGYEKIGKFKPDLILLDIIMPKMDGYEVMEKMNEDNSKIPVIIISNSGQPVEIEKTKKLGAIDHLIKTEFSPSDVLEKVRNYVENKGGPAFGDTTENEPKEDINAKKLGIKVLLVEDESFLRKMCSKQLIKEGFTVYEAKDGEEALILFKKNKIDIVLLDIILPSIDGFQVLKEVRSGKNKIKAKTPIIMLSNLGQESDIVKAKKMGANDFMVKANFTSREIAEATRKFFKK
ncbi:response regulator [bacterium]|nr:response regulator [bacterium]